jgi:serpin B
MVILLPAQADGWRQLEQQLSPAFLSGVLAQMHPQFLEVFLPRFTLESSFDLTETLGEMGMPDAFAPGAADFSGIDGAEDLYITHVLHKAWGAVNEAGTEAAAATVVTVGTLAMPLPLAFRADHPFIFLIRDTQSGSLLFLGRVADPGQSAPNVAAAPQLSITQSGHSLAISWPYPSAGWTLWQNPDLSTTNWTPGSGISNDGTNNFLNIPAPPRSMFFRLSQP